VRAEVQLARAVRYGAIRDVARCGVRVCVAVSLSIREVLNRRTDLSTFIVHLTRDSGGGTARQALDSIISSRKLRARTPMGWAKDEDDPKDRKKQTQRVVCFSETPLEHIYLLVTEIEGRSTRLQPYGLAFTKLVARRMGINPIWYIDMTPGQKKKWALRNAIEELRDDAIKAGNFHAKPIARLTPFMEQMGTWPTRNSQKEFWWEREWRHVGDLRLPKQKIIWLCPEDEWDSLPADIGPVIDPRWGLEQIIARLAGFASGDVTPFAPHEEQPEQGAA